MTRIYGNSLADIDPRMLSEAFRRAREKAAVTDIDSDSLLSAIIAEARRGTRDMYGLVKAAETSRANYAA
jgi:hypothetical protein